MGRRVEERSDGQFFAFQLSSFWVTTGDLHLCSKGHGSCCVIFFTVSFLSFLSFSYIYLFIIYLHQARLRHFNF